MNLDDHEQIVAFLAERMFYRNITDSLTGVGYDADPDELAREWSADPLLREFWITQIMAVFADIDQLIELAEQKLS